MGSNPTETILNVWWVRIPREAFVKIRFKRSKIVNSGMETFATIMMIFGIVSFCIAGVLKLYSFAYDRGHRHGTHSGFSQGLFAAQERMNRNKPILARKLSI